MAMMIELNDIVTSVSHRAGALRFAQRGEKRILQQEWETFTSHASGIYELTTEWRDVPLVDEPENVTVR